MENLYFLAFFDFYSYSKKILESLKGMEKRCVKSPIRFRANQIQNGNGVVMEPQGNARIETGLKPAVMWKCLVRDFINNVA